MFSHSSVSRSVLQRGQGFLGRVESSPAAGDLVLLRASAALSNAVFVGQFVSFRLGMFPSSLVTHQGRFI